jgi:HEAT repeat protein
MQRIHIPGMLAIPHGSIMPDQDKLDPQTRVKIEALNTLMNGKEDSISFQALRDIALDRSQPQQLRETAISNLSNFQKFDVTPVFVELAKNDTSEEVQSTAIYQISQSAKNKNQAVQELIEIFNNVPARRTNQLENILYQIAEIGNDRAVEFLSNIALTSENYDLRSGAIYHLGNIGGEKARRALYQILKGK